MRRRLIVGLVALGLAGTFAAGAGWKWDGKFHPRQGTRIAGWTWDEHADGWTWDDSTPVDDGWTWDTPGV